MNAPMIKKRKVFLKRLNEDKGYLLFILPTLIILLVFVYKPLYGLAIAFQDYSPGKPILSFTGQTRWVGFAQFTRFFQSVFFKRILWNTVRLSLFSLVWSAWIPLVAALLLNELRIPLYKRVVQTAFYLPYFVSTVIVVSILTLLLNSNGPVSMISKILGGNAINWLSEPRYFDTIYVASGIWKNFGYSSIIYLAGIAGVDAGLYEAVMIDGGNRFHKLWHVTLPAIIPTFVILLVLSIGSLLGTDSQKILLMYNSSTMDQADVIGTYVYRVGLQEARYSYTTAVGLFTNILNFVLVYGANVISRKMTGYSLW
jgi:putative aldouronate transport system permease protein